MGKRYRDMTAAEKKRSLRSNRDWAKRNPDKVKVIQKRHYDRTYSAQYHRFKRYGLTQAAFDALLASQSGACAICGARDPGKTWHVDHDHLDGVVRGILCLSCNGGLGLFRDNPVLLRNAIGYLQRTALAKIL